MNRTAGFGSKLRPPTSIPRGDFETMQTGGIQGLELVFLLLLLFVVAFGSLARKLQLPYPIVLVQEPCSVSSPDSPGSRCVLT
jgi:hypothetical protein